MTRHKLASRLPEMCAWCSSQATCRVEVPTPELEARYGRVRKANACDRHAVLNESRPADGASA